MVRRISERAARWRRGRQAASQEEEEVEI